MGGQALFRDDLSKGAPLSSEPLRSCLLEAHHQEAFPGAAGETQSPARIRRAQRPGMALPGMRESARSGRSAGKGMRRGTEGSPGIMKTKAPECACEDSQRPGGTVALIIA